MPAGAGAAAGLLLAERSSASTVPLRGRYAGAQREEAVPGSGKRPGKTDHNGLERNPEGEPHNEASTRGGSCRCSHGGAHELPDRRRRGDHPAHLERTRAELEQRQRSRGLPVHSVREVQHHREHPAEPGSGLGEKQLLAQPGRLRDRRPHGGPSSAFAHQSAVQDWERAGPLDAWRHLRVLLAVYAELFSEGHILHVPPTSRTGSPRSR